MATVCESPFETRVFYKEAKTLSAAGYEVVLIAKHDKAETVGGVRIIPVFSSRNRFYRMAILTLAVFFVALKEKADIYHFHYPELIPIALLLKLCNKVVIYDVHEAFGEKILTKHWIKPWLRPVVSRCFSWFERGTSKYFDHIITADRFVAKQFNVNNVSVVANYPILEISHNEGAQAQKPERTGKTTVIYAGGITEDRGFYKMVDALDELLDIDVELHLLGRIPKGRMSEYIKDRKNVISFGFLPLEEVFEHLASASVSFALFQPVPAYLYAAENTTKLFEYMACSLPVIVSNFKNLKRIVEESECGIAVDPTSPSEIAKAVRLLHDNPRLRAEMGSNGRKAALKKYNWEQEGKKLLAIYKSLSAGM